MPRQQKSKVPKQNKVPITTICRLKNVSVAQFQSILKSMKTVGKKVRDTSVSGGPLQHGIFSFVAHYNKSAANDKLISIDSYFCFGENYNFVCINSELNASED